MKLPQATLNNNLIIAVTGPSGSGKSTALRFILDCLVDMGIKDFKHKGQILIEGINANTLIPKTSAKPYVLLYDTIESVEICKLLKQQGAIILYIRGKQDGALLDEPTTALYSLVDLYLSNDAELRRFEFTVRDSVKNIFPELKQFKKAITLQ